MGKCHEIIHSMTNIGVKCWCGSGKKIKNKKRWCGGDRPENGTFHAQIWVVQFQS